MRRQLCGPGELGRREARLALVLDPEGVDPRALRLADVELRRDRMEHARQSHGLSVLDSERDGALDRAFPDVEGGRPAAEVVRRAVVERGVAGTDQVA